jgi:hypothetical protein
VLSRYCRAKIERRRRGGRTNGARRERADPAFERWRGAHARRRRFAGDRPARSALGGRAKTLGAEDIEAHVPLFKDYSPTAALLATAGAWDESKHLPVPAGSPDHQGGRFIHGEGGAVAECWQAVSDIGHNGGPPLGQPPEIPEEDPLAENLRKPLLSMREAPYP